jgi:hypothetical protein
MGDTSDDDSSYCPSECPSLDFEGSIEPEDDLAEFFEQTRDELPDDEDFDEWTAVEFKGAVTLHYDDVDTLLMEKMKDQIALVQKNIENQEKFLQAGGGQGADDRKCQNVQLLGAASFLP